MGVSAAFLKIRVFLEGNEIPAIAVQVRSEPNSPATAVLQVLPLAEGARLLPRTLVHVFFYDTYEQAAPHLTYRGNTAKLRPSTRQTQPTVYQQQEDAYWNGEDTADDRKRIDEELKLTHYKLLFVGEVVGFQWTKSPINRSLVLQCMDLSNYWDYAQQWENTDLFGPGYKAMFSGGSTNMFTDFLSSKDEEIIKTLMSPSARFPALKGILGGIIHLLEKIGGVYQGDHKFEGQNIFYSLAELRLKLTQQICAYPGDDTSAKLLNAQGWEAMWGRVLGNLGDQVSFRASINALMSVIFHETYAVSSPRFVPGTNGTSSGTKRTRLDKLPDLAYIPMTAHSVTVTLQLVRAIVDGTSTDESYATVYNSPKGGKFYVVDALTSARNQVIKTGNQSRQGKIKSKDAPGLLSTLASQLGQIISVVHTKWQIPVRPIDGPNKPTPTSTQILQLIEQAIEQSQRIERLELVESQGQTTIPALLKSQIFRPDVWFTAPPRCNVIFPDQYMQLSYARAFMQEPTRLLLKTHDAFFGEDELFDSFYFAPKGITKKSEKRDLQALLAGDILDHELFTGILPVFEKMAETNIFAVKSAKIDGKMPKVGLAQRSANFLYFKYRFASRQLSVSCRFNPYVVVGFPGLIIDKYVDRDRLEQLNRTVQNAAGVAMDVRDQLGMHFLASFTSITHNLSQGQAGSTEITCGYARDYNESSEFLGVANLDTTVVKKTGNASRTTDVATLAVPKIGMLGPGYGVISAVTDITKSATGTRLPFYNTKRQKGTAQTEYVDIGGLKAPANTYGPAVVQAVGSPDALVSFKAYRIAEDVPQYRQDKVDLPVEGLISPGWYGNAWSTANVGRVYLDFFDTTAITDPTQIADPGGADIGSSNADAIDAYTEAQRQTEADASNPSEDLRNPDEVPAIFALDEKSSIAQAVAFLVMVYSYIKNGDLDADDFIKTYTWRPIATMTDMFGSTDLQYSADGLQVQTGVEGFHSRAFGPYADLFGLLGPEVTEVLNVKSTMHAKNKLDTRLRKWEAVQRYVAQARIGRAFVG